MEEKSLKQCVLFSMSPAIGLVFTNAFYVGYDVASTRSATDALDGSVSVVMSLLYCGVGVYAHRLAFRLFVHPKVSFNDWCIGGLF